MFSLFVFSLEIAGTIAFSVSGALVAIDKKMDIFGVVILGLVTAVGGGIIRDLVLGITPPTSFVHPIYAFVALCASLFTFLPQVRTLLKNNRIIHELVMLVADALGLGIFTVVGIDSAFRSVADPSLYLLIFVGVITGVGGGLMRDIMAGRTPSIFVKQFYACASIIGALICVSLWYTSDRSIAMAGGTLAVVILRVMAAHYKWNLPRA